jgi:hypothetical protein
MNWITSPNRAYGVGETKQQNAVIKVYSVAEFKKALSKIYQLPSNVGTIEIAGDITITEPIKLKAFEEQNIQPKEIIIQAVSGARIINGNKNYGTAYDYNTPANKNIPVFDFGIIPVLLSKYPQCKYTFKDLTINTETAKPFGAFIAANATAIFSYMPRITITNIKAANLWNIFATYNTNLPFTNLISVLYSTVIDDFKFANYDTTITETSINSQYFGSFNGNFANIGLWDMRLFGTSRNKIKFNNINEFQANYISSITCETVISGNDGRGNVITASTINASSYVNGFNYIQCNEYLTLNDSTIIETNLEQSAFNITGVDTSNNIATSTTHVIKNTGGFIRAILTILPNTFYEVDWKLTVRYTATGSVNAYHFKTSFKVNGAGVGTVINTSTIFAIEEVTTLIGLVPTVDANGLYIQPSDTPNAIECNCTIVIDGFKLPVS